jgi:hypothetical protein
VRRLYLATLLVSAAAIGYEILLMRMLSIVQWHHFAWMIISLALLGYGASGTCIALLRPRLEPRFQQAFALSALLFSISMLACFVLGQHVPFNALEIVWDRRQLLYLGLLYFVFFLPFFFAACCIGLVLSFCRNDIARLYFFDLFGAGAGAVLVVGLLFVVFPQTAVVVLVALALLASFLVRPVRVPRIPMLAGQFVWLLVVAAVALRGGPPLKVSEYKGLSQALQVVDARVLSESSSPLGLLTVVESPTVPIRLAPGLSFTTSHIPPEQLAVFTDAEGMSAITRYDGDPDTLAYLGDTSAALPYRLLRAPDVLVLGAGGGRDVLLALFHGARHITAVELNPNMTELVAETWADFAGRIYADPRVDVHTAEARGFVAGSDERYDLIHIGLLDSFAASGAGVQALNESYLYTVQALREYLEHLTPGGLLSVTRWIKSPPRDNLKLAATAIEALRLAGVAEPGRQLAVIRSWNTVTLLVKNGEFAPAEIATLREFARTRSFDTAWFPGIGPDDVNRYNVLERPWLYEGISQFLLGNPAAYYENYKFHIKPATDDSPYFFHFFKWRTLPEVLALRAAGGAGLIEWGYLVVITTLAQALLAGALLILLPLARIERTGTGGVRYATYFLLLGLAFLFVEIAFIQKFILFLSHPLYSVAVVLAGFLVFAGAGSACSAWLADRAAARGIRPVSVAVLGIAALAIIYLLALPSVFGALMGIADGLKILLAVTLIAPLAFLMGMPFPLGLTRLAKDAPDFVPWAWGINGFASVVAAVLASVLAIHVGFVAVIAVAVALYVAAAALRVA